MKVLMLADSMETGGAETHIETLSTELLRLGCTVAVASRGGAVADRLSRTGVRHIMLSKQLIIMPSDHHKEEFQKCRVDAENTKAGSVTASSRQCTNQEAFRSKTIDISHKNSSVCSAPIFFLSVFTVIARERPEIVHAHTRMTAFAAHFACKIFNIPLVVTAHAHFSMTPLKRLLSKWGDATIAVSEDIKEHLLRHTSLPPDRITVIENGVKVDRDLR